MRGILLCWVRQSDRIEQFKKKQCDKFALHSKFNLMTGEEVYTDEEYNHLQVIFFFLNGNVGMQCSKLANTARQY